MFWKDAETFYKWAHVLYKLFHLTHINRLISVKARTNFRSFHNGFVSHEIEVSAPQQKSQAKYTRDFL